MTRRIILFIWLAFFYQLSFAQLSTDPAIPIDTKPVTITFDSSKETRLGYYTGDLYAHTGVIIAGNTAWQHVIGNWGNNTVQPKLTNLGNGIYQLSITPDIRTFYSVLSSEVVKQIALVFRSADGTKQTNDLFINVSTDGLHVSIVSPSTKSIYEKGQSFSFTANSTLAADLKLFLNNQPVSSTTGTTITNNTSIANAGNYWLKATATLNTQTVADSVYVCIRETTTNATQPAGLKTGINYIDDQTATLLLWAPYKNYVFVVGDFNNWLPDNNYQMKKDGDYYWITLTGLTPQKEYVFQYLIDGKLQVADAYTDKISGPYDQYISSTTYPNLIPYPAGKAVDRASVLETGQSPYVWQNTNYTIPDASKLAIYELLIRDFTPEGTYKAVQEKLPYLKRLGINAIELMPFSNFEGNISWGYNPNFYFAPDKAYGTKDDLKSLIDECHKEGFVVIQDMVLNHAYNSCPLVQMYWDAVNNRPAANNPWFNVTSPNPAYSWGNDFNHQSPATQAFVDRVTSYWMTEYKIDGFRFDFTKGFTNTPGDGWAFDPSRIAILERMAGKIWEVNPNAIVILEHFTANSEEQVLTSFGNGMLVWGYYNQAGYAAFNEAAMGYNDSGKSDFSWDSYQQRGFTKPGLVSYMESHDQERQMYQTETFGNAAGSYNTKNLSTALDRSKLATTFFMCLAGPKMIWQFGELGYDVSINTCANGSLSDNCRTDPKPLHPEYLQDSQRLKLFDVYSAMLRLRAQYDVFTSGTETLSVAGPVKTIQLTLNDHNITLIGNFDVTSQTANVNFQHTGTWYEFFTGGSLAVNSTSSSFSLQPGEFRLYSDKQLPAFKDLATAVLPETQTLALRVFPNPTLGEVHIESPTKVQKIEVFSMSGKLILQVQPQEAKSTLRLNDLKAGVYFLRVQTNDQLYNEKIVKN